MAEFMDEKDLTILRCIFNFHRSSGRMNMNLYEMTIMGPAFPPLGPEAAAGRFRASTGSHSCHQVAHSDDKERVDSELLGVGQHDLARTIPKFPANVAAPTPAPFTLAG